VLIFERKTFRRTYDAKYEDGEWKSRRNRELEELIKGENTVKWLKGQRISWLGHLEIMEEDRMPKKIYTQELEGMKRRGRPRKGWGEEGERDLQVMGVRRWKELLTGQNGGTLFDRPKPTAGCSANGRRRRIIRNYSCTNVYFYIFYVHMSVRRKYISKIQPTRCNVFSIYLFT
jgi:hypothetical protein